MGIVAYKKYQFKSSKNIIVGAIVGIICLFNIGLVLMNHKILTSKNNNQLIETIKNTTQTQMPRDYYTIYFENELDSKQMMIFITILKHIKYGLLIKKLKLKN